MDLVVQTVQGIMTKVVVVVVLVGQLQIKMVVWDFYYLVPSKVEILVLLVIFYQVVIQVQEIM